MSPLGSLAIELGAGFEMFPLPRFWIESPNGEMLMQIQRNAFLFNWRKREGNYPHFESVKKSFDRNFALFVNFLEKELSLQSPEIQVAELTYINLIERTDYWSGPRPAAIQITMRPMPQEVIHNRASGINMKPHPASPNIRSFGQHAVANQF
jgi:hypothetical protein